MMAFVRFKKHCLRFERWIVDTGTIFVTIDRLLLKLDSCHPLSYVIQVNISCLLLEPFFIRIILKLLVSAFFYSSC